MQDETSQRTEAYRVFWRSLYLDPLHRRPLHLQKSVEEMPEALQVFLGNLENTFHFLKLFLKTFKDIFFPFHWRKAD